MFYKTPFSASYWRDSVKEVHDLKKLVIAALFVAIRVALKSAKIPIPVDNQSIYMTFVPNAVSAMICGPVLSLMSGMVSDILGYLVDSSGGGFNILFTLVEMSGSFIYALFLYKVKVSIVRLFLAKVTVSAVCNLVMTPLLISLLYGSKSYVVLLLARLPKNIICLPFEVIILCLVFTAVLPLINRMRIIKVNNKLSII